MGKSAAPKADPKKASKESKEAKDAKAAADAKAEEAKAKLLEEATQKLADDERDEKTRGELLALNRQARANGAGELKGKRDKGITRVQKFQNKLKLFKGESELASVISDIDGTDASKYVAELAACILESAGVNLKLKELFAGVKVCSRLHATYDDFAGLLQKALEKAYKATPASELNRRRFLFRFHVELCLVECLAKPACTALLLEMVKELTDISVAEEQVITNFTIIVSFVQKHAVSCLNVIPSKQKTYEEALGRSWVERTCVLEDAQRTQLMQLIVNAYQNSASGLLHSAHTRLLEQEKVNAKLRIDKGQVDAENEQKHQQLKEQYTKLQSSLQTLSEFLNQPMPTAQEENPEATRLAGAAKQEATQDVADELPMLWDDAEQQRFYEDLLDCKAVIPAVLLGIDKGGSAPPASDTAAAAAAAAAVAPAEGEKEGKAQLAASDFELYLARVAKAEGTKQVDDLVQEFFHDFNSKGNRRSLAASLYDTFRAAPHLLAQRARFIATVAPYMKEVSAYVLAGLQKDLETLVAEKDPERLEAKVKTVRYLCELCKFRVCPPGVILDAFKTFLDDFSQHHAELGATILQCCGRFLYHSPETSTRTENLLERMMRLKNVKSLPLRLEIMLEDAYYQMKPPEGKQKKAKEKDHLELFVRDLVFVRLYSDEDDENNDKVLRLVRKLPWDSGSEAPKWLKKSILELNLHSNYENIYQLASLLSGLAKYRDFFVIDVIDSLCESIQVCLERNDFREAPLRVRQVKLLGELYNYRLIDSNIVFDMMYHLIGFGGPSMHRAGAYVTAHKVLERALAAKRAGLGSIAEDDGEDTAGMQMPPQLVDPQHPVEPPYDFFRIKLVCVLLETCGHYFSSGAVKSKLDRFIQFFMRYVLTKGELPLRMQYMVSDMLERLRPKLQQPKDLAALDAQILKLLKVERDNLDLSQGKEAEADEGKDAGSDEESSEEGSSSDESDSSSGEGSESEDSSSSDSDEEDAQEQAGRRAVRRDADYDRNDQASRQQADEFDEFDREVQQMLIDALEVGKSQPRVQGDLPTLPTAAKKNDSAPEFAPGMFSLMQRKQGGKVVMKDIEIPEDSKLARVAVKQRDQEESKEQEELKRFIIQYDQMGSRAVGAPLPPAGLRPLNVQHVQLRQGKSGKGGGKKGKSDGKSGRDRGTQEKDYLRESFLPEEGSGSLAEEQPPPPPPRVKAGGGGKGGKGGDGAGGKARKGGGTPAQGGARGGF